MRKVKILLAVLISLIAVIVGSYFIVKLARPKPSGLYIDSTPQSIVFINGVQEGRTPLRKDNLKDGEVTIKMVPVSSELTLSPYNTQVYLNPGTETVIKKEFAEEAKLSGLELIYFDKASPGATGISIVTVPEAAEVYIDGNLLGETPYRSRAIQTGKHRVMIRKSGFVEINVDLNVYQGHELTYYVELKSEIEKSAVGLESKVNQLQDYVKILDTPTGFLRVRSEPSTASDEVGQVEPGDLFEFMETDETQSWYLIKLDEKTAGWVSSQYTEKILQQEDQLQATTSGKISN